MKKNKAMLGAREWKGNLASIGVAEVDIPEQNEVGRQLYELSEERAFLTEGIASAKALKQVCSVWEAVNVAVR